jgi:hypothetical protein
MIVGVFGWGNSLCNQLFLLNCKKGPELMSKLCKGVQFSHMSSLCLLTPHDDDFIISRVVSLILWSNDSTACERQLFDLSGPVRYRSFACHIVSYGRAINNWATLSLKYPRPTISREAFTL